MRTLPLEMHTEGIFYCTSPLQLLSAFEARAHFQIASAILVVNSDPATTVGSSNDYRDLIQEQGWGEVMYLDRTSRSRFKEQLKVLRLLGKISFDRLFLGEWSSFGRVLHGSCHFKEAFLLDDGVATLRQQREIVLPSLFLSKRKRVWDFWRDFRFALLGIRKRGRPQIAFFSSIVSRPIRSERVVTHQFQALRSKYWDCSNPNPTDQAVFLGTHLEASPEFTGDVMRRIHASAEAAFPELFPIDFYLHRNESLANLGEYLPPTMYVFKDYRGPIELQLLRQKRYPSVIVSTVSSGLLTLKSIFPKSRVIALDVRGFMRDPSGADWVYDLFCSCGVEVQCLDGAKAGHV